MNILKTVDKNLEQWMLIIFYLMIFVTILMEVIQRFVLSFSTAWGEEMARYCFIYLIWISSAFCVKERIHLKIDFIVASLSNRGKSIFYLGGEIITLIIVSLSVYLSFETVLLSIEYHSVTDGLRIVKAVFLFAVPFGLSIMIFRVIQNMLKDIKNIRLNHPPYEGNPIF